MGKNDPTLIYFPIPDSKNALNVETKRRLWHEKCASKIFKFLLIKSNLACVIKPRKRSTRPNTVNAKNAKQLSLLLVKDCASKYLYT
jgi:hypothetical protein